MLVCVLTWKHNLPRCTHVLLLNYFQEIETELRQMEEIKEQYQKKNYEQVGALSIAY